MTFFGVSQRINQERFEGEFRELSGIGSTGDGGVHRPALSEAHLAAREWFRAAVVEAGLEFYVDSAGNHSGRLFCQDPEAPTLLIGSHLDSVPNGGRYDGALGVLAALEVLRTVKELAIQLPVHLEAIDFTDEEGTLIGLMGSRALAGTLKAAELHNPRGGWEAFSAGLSRAGLQEEGLLSAARPPGSLAGFLEVHIEQSNRLSKAGANIGIVGSLVGIGSVQIKFIGRADHAGTTSMDERIDAGIGASEFVLSSRHLVIDEFPTCVCNVGKLDIQPGVLNIVPCEAVLGVEFRSPDQAELTELRKKLFSLAEDIADKYDLGIETRSLGQIPSTPCSPEIQAAFRSASERLGLKSIPLNSGAGHDTMAMAAVCPAGMIFIPSTGGSHSATEHADWEDCINGANVLLQTALELALV